MISEAHSAAIWADPLQALLDFVTPWHILAYNFQTVYILINIWYIIWKV